MIDGPKSNRAAPPDAGGNEVVDGASGLIGRLVAGKFRVEKLLGGGAMGAVYRARFAALDKNVALKVMHPSIAAESSFVARFHREAKAASRLDHPNSIRVIDFGAEPDGLLYIAMEYVEGRDLFQVMTEDWPLETADVADIMMQALAALAVAHEMGIVHRDMKPENLMIVRGKNDEERDAYHVKVCDFGIAKLTEKEDESEATAARPGPARKLTTQGVVVGTPEYMSPEQAKGEKLDARSDLYAMGIILYQLLTGRTPFTGENAISVVLKHITEEPVAPSVHYAGVHPALEAVTMRAIAKNRDDRWQTARKMRAAIRDAVAGQPVLTDSQGALPAAPDFAAATTTAGFELSQPPKLATVALALAATMPLEALPASATTDGTGGAIAETPPPRPRRRGGLVAGLIAGVIALAAFPFAVKAYRARPDDRARPTVPVAATELPTAHPSAVSAPSTSAMVSLVTTSTVPSSSPAERGPLPPPREERSASSQGRKPTTIASPRPEAPVASTAEPVAMTPAPPEPAPPMVTPPSPPPAIVVAAPAPVFDPGTCRAAMGSPRATGATNSKDIMLSGTGDAWTSCVRSALRERPAAPITATVHLDFSDTGAFRSASCATCPPPLAACVAANTARTVRLNIHGGDLTGEPSFDVPVVFRCE